MILLAAALLFSVYDGGPVPPGVENLLVVPGTSLPAGIHAKRVEPVALERAGANKAGLLVVAAGTWPGLHPTVALEGGTDVGFAAATSEPWVDSNGWIFRYLRAVEPSKPIVVVYGPSKGATPKRGSTALALAEAAVFGGSYGVPSSALADRATAAQWEFIAAHQTWFAGQPEAPVAVVADRLEPVSEVMNLLVRRNVPFSAITRGRWPDATPSVLVRIGQPPPDETESRRINAWRAAGTKIIERPSVEDPNEFARDLRSALGRRRPFRLSNGQEVIGSLNRLPDGKRVLHLLNYGIDRLQDVRVELAVPAARATLFAPGSQKGVPLDTAGGQIAVPEFGVYAAILLEN